MIKWLIVAAGMSMMMLPRSLSAQSITTKEGVKYFFPTVFGWKEGESVKEHMYTLMGLGLYQSERSSNTDSLINAWIANHPHADVTPITTVTVKDSTGEVSRVTFCWISEQNDTLNLALVKQGCVPGGTMLRAKARHELTAEEKETAPSEDVFKVEVFVNDEDFKRFIESVRKAEGSAYLLKLGLWKDYN